MSTFLSAYTINFTDPVETGRTKINYLISGDTSPFSIWSGTPETQKFLSVYRILFPLYTNNKNYISYKEGSQSGVSNFNFIPNGEDNLINILSATTDSFGSYNLINGFSNKIENFSFNSKTNNNLILGSGNTINAPTNNNFISGEMNNIFAYGGKNNIISSKNSFIYDIFFLNKFNSLISSDNSNIGQSSNALSFNFVHNFISGKNNSILNTYQLAGEINGFNFIGNGYNNKIIKTATNYNNSDFSAIINGQNNYIDKKKEHRNSILFGSNLTAVTSGYSHFENISIGEVLNVAKVKTYIVNSAPSQNVEIDLNYSFHEIYNVNQSGVRIYIPNSYNDLQILSICISGGTNPSPFISFTDNTFAAFPTNLSLKSGQFNRYTSFFIGSPDPDVVAYFFMWTSKINKWVMFNSDTSITSYF
jgi:hypothetical protein